MLPALGSPEVSPGFTDAHQFKDCVHFPFSEEITRVVNVGREKGSPGWGGGGGPHPKTWHVQSEQPRWGEAVYPPSTFCFAFCLQSNAEQQMSVTKKLENKETHKT